jgi:phosphoglycerate dehydrogenase-like enzyme
MLVTKHNILQGQRITMSRMGILSRDARHYQSLLEHQNLHELQIVFAEKDPAQVEDFEHIDILLTDPDLAATIIEHCTNLKWLQSTWAGNKPLFDSTKRDYQLCGVKDVFGSRMREYVFAYLLHFARNVEGFIEAQKSRRWQAPDISYLHGRKLGIMGVGSIGNAVAKTAKDFAMEVHGFTHSSTDCSYVDHYYKLDELENFASKLDYLVCLLPDTQNTQGLVDKVLLDALPEHCVLINAGRGQCINDGALIAALQSNRLRAAVVDVTSEEPLPFEHPFWYTANLYLSQHTAAISEPEDISTIFAANYHRYVNKQGLHYLLDFTKAY